MFTGFTLTGSSLSGVSDDMQDDFQTARLNMRTLAFSPLLSPDERKRAMSHLIRLLKEALKDAEGYL